MISTIYAFIWFFVLMISYIPVSNIIISPTLNILLLIILSSFFFFIIDATTFQKSKVIFKNDKNDKLLSNLIMLLLGLILISAVYSSLKFPILKLFHLPALEYNEYGLKGLQGLVNALYLALMTLIFFRKLYFSDIKYNFIFYILLIYPILIISRQVLLSLIIQLFFIWILHSKKKLYKKLIIIFLIGLVVITSFGKLGDIRVANEQYSARDLLIETLEPTEFGNTLPNSLLWVYMYTTSPVSTLMYNFDTAEPDGEVFNYIKSLLPSPLRKLINSENNFEGYKNINLIKHNLNMGTAYIAPYLSLGYFGVFFHVLVLGLFLLIVKLIYKINYYFYLNYFLAIQIFILTIFTNTLFYLPIIFQFVIFVLLGISQSRKSISKEYNGLNNHTNL